MPPQTGLTKYASGVRWVFWESNKEHTSPSSVSRQHFMRFTLADFCVSWTTHNHAHAFSFNQNLNARTVVSFIHTQKIGTHPVTEQLLEPELRFANSCSRVSRSIQPSAAV